MPPRQWIPEADGLVVTDGGQLLAVWPVCHKCRRRCVTAQDGIACASGDVVEVNLVLLNAAGCYLSARWAQGKRSGFPARRVQHERGAVELVVEVVPFPVAVFLRRTVECPARRSAVLKLQGPGRNGDIRPVAAPAFGVATALGFGARLLRGLSGNLIVMRQVAKADGGDAGHQHCRGQQESDHTQRRRDSPVSPRPAG